MDGATCAFGDAVALGPTFVLTEVELDTSARAVDLTGQGIPLIAFATMEDGELAVEVNRDGTGSIVAARMCATSDVDEVTGAWRPVGDLEIASGRCLAADPYCPANEYYRLEFDIAPGSYRAEVFDFTPVGGAPDCLALRIRRRQPASGGAWPGPDHRSRPGPFDCRRAGGAASPAGAT